MRITESLILPDTLELARSSGELVIFAGGGCRWVPFESSRVAQLAREIAESVVSWDEAKYSNRLDLYPGDAERKGVRVQERARDKLSGRGGGQTLLHENLLGTFATADTVRLITTNFDPHFSTAAKAV